MTREEALETLIDNAENGCVDIEEVKLVFAELEQKPCEDAISRAEAIRIASGYCHPANIAKELGKLPPVLPKQEQRWIPVSERLPEDGERVLATHLGGINPDRQVIEHIYENGKFVLGWDMDMDMASPTFGQRYMGDVIAWMPLPKPYRGESEEE